MTRKITDPRIDAYFEKYFKRSIASMCEMDGEMPLVKGSHTVPKCLVSFHDAKKNYWRGAFIHFFNNDYQFDGEHGIWLDTAKHLPVLEQYRGVISPDFSLYSNDSIIPQMWNTYRNRLVQCHLERLGFDVIPCASWGKPETFNFCFKGLPKNIVVAVSTLGVIRSPGKRALFEVGYSEMSRRIAPELVVLYGSTVGLALDGAPYINFTNTTYNWAHLPTTKRKVM